MDMMRQLAAIALVLALLGGALWALRRQAGPLRSLPGARRRDKTLEVVARVALTPHHSLHVIRMSTEEWILATHPQGCTVVHRKSSPGAAA